MITLAGKLELWDRTNLRYTIDSDNPASCVAIGPDLFHISTLSFYETNTHMGVTNIGAGTHTIRPCYQAQDLNVNNSSFSRLEKRCLTVECRTQ
ncbi:MAG TPA: hypothetical protein VHT73_02050 [Thermodesulfobacteriota bacterium]|nr:hypothetical protein [Thermodesulfobacteriota bacterium]